MQRGDTLMRVASNIVVLSIRPQARSGSPRFRWRSGFAETYTRERVCRRQTTGPNYMAHYGSEGALCRPNDLLSTLGGYEPSGGKVQENDAERRHASAYRLEHRCLVYKTPSAERLSALPLAFGLCLQHTRGSVYVAGKQPARNIWLTAEVRERFADRTTCCRRSAAMSRAEGKSKKTSQSKRGAFVNDVVLNIKK